MPWNLILLDRQASKAWRVDALSLALLTNLILVKRKVSFCLGKPRKKMEVGKAIEDATNPLCNAQSAAHTYKRSNSEAHCDGTRRHVSKRRNTIYRDASCKKNSCEQASWRHAVIGGEKKRPRQGCAFRFVKHGSNDATDCSFSRPNASRSTKCRKIRPAEYPVSRVYGSYGRNTRVAVPWQQDQGACDFSRVEAWVMETLELGNKALSEDRSQRYWHRKLEIERVIEDHGSAKECSITFIIAEICKLVSCFAFFLLIFGLL